MKKIKFFPAPHVEVRVSVTDEMAMDLRECKRMEEATNCEGYKNCGDCSWKEVEIKHTNMCGVEDVCRQVLEEGEK